MRLAFHYDPRTRDYWAHLALTYRVSEVFEIGAPLSHEGSWISVPSLEDVPGRHIYFAPLGSPHTSGTISLPDYVWQARADDVLCFGSDSEHNRFWPETEDLVVYISTPRSAPLFSFQAASIALHDLWRS